MPEKRVELWLPTSEVKVTVIDGVVSVWDEMTMERKLIPRPAGFSDPNQDLRSSADTPSREASSPNKEKGSS